jgi:hypothetical protein
VRRLNQACSQDYPRAPLVFKGSMTHAFCTSLFASRFEGKAPLRVLIGESLKIRFSACKVCTGRHERSSSSYPSQSRTPAGAREVPYNLFSQYVLFSACFGRICPAARLSDACSLQTASRKFSFQHCFTDYTAASGFYLNSAEAEVHPSVWMRRLGMSVLRRCRSDCLGKHYSSKYTFEA